MRRNYFLLRIAFVFVTACALLLSPSTFGEGPVLRICDGRTACTWTGFLLSIGDPNQRGPAQLRINPQVDNSWTGLFTLFGNTYAVTGRVNANGVLSFTSHTGLTGTGKWQDLTRGGSLLLATYQLGSGHQGKVILLQKFQQPPDPDIPPDIAGSWRGTYQSSLSLMRGTDEWIVLQDRTETGAPGTWFTGQETLDGGTPAIQLSHYSGTIDGHGNFVRIGVSIRGFVIEGGKQLESGELTAHSVRNFADGGQDDLVFVITRN